MSTKIILVKAGLRWWYDPLCVYLTEIISGCVENIYAIKHLPKRDCKVKDYISMKSSSVRHCMFLGQFFFFLSFIKFRSNVGFG